jgi:Tripartite tricarboxylate transporter family receptor
MGAARPSRPMCWVKPASQAQTARYQGRVAEALSIYDGIAALGPVIMHAARCARYSVVDGDRKFGSGTHAGGIRRLCEGQSGQARFCLHSGDGAVIGGRMAEVNSGIDLTSLPYRGGSQLFADIAAGRIHLYIAPASASRPSLEQGKVAFWSAQRSPQCPDVPTMIESGYPRPPAIGSDCSRRPAPTWRLSSRG